MEQRFVSGKAPQLDLGFFQPVNLVVDVLQLAPVRRAVKMAVGQIGHLAQHGIIRRLKQQRGNDVAVGVEPELAGRRIERGQVARLLINR